MYKCLSIYQPKTLRSSKVHSHFDGQIGKESNLLPSLLSPSPPTFCCAWLPHSKPEKATMFDGGVNWREQNSEKPKTKKGAQRGSGVRRSLPAVWAMRGIRHFAGRPNLRGSFLPSKWEGDGTFSHPSGNEEGGKAK
jgi:hypothetical protein